MSQSTLGLLNAIIQGFDDWSATFDPESCSLDQAKEAQARISEHGGTPAYADKLIEDAKKLFESESFTITGKVTLGKVCCALSDWSATCSDTVSASDAQEYSQERIANGGGTLAYIYNHRCLAYAFYVVFEEMMPS